MYSSTYLYILFAQNPLAYGGLPMDPGGKMWECSSKANTSIPAAETHRLIISPAIRTLCECVCLRVVCVRARILNVPRMWLSKKHFRRCPKMLLSKRHVSRQLRRPRTRDKVGSQRAQDDNNSCFCYCWWRLLCVEEFAWELQFFKVDLNYDFNSILLIYLFIVQWSRSTHAMIDKALCSLSIIIHTQR